MEEAERGIFVNYKEEQRGNNRYQVYSCSCDEKHYAPYEQIILHLKLEHKFTLQYAELVVHYSKKPELDLEKYF